MDTMSRRLNCSSIVSLCGGSFLFRSECVPWHPCHLLLWADIIVRIHQLGCFVLVFLLLWRFLLCSNFGRLRHGGRIRLRGLGSFRFPGSAGNKIIKRGRIRRLLSCGIRVSGCRLWLLLNTILRGILFLEGLIERRWIWEIRGNLTLMHLLHLESINLRRAESRPLGQARGSW
jgi:hypothetical protein